MGKKSFIGGLAVGAGLVYLLDLEKGELRRERLRERLGNLLDRAREHWELGGSESPIVRSHRFGARKGDIDGLGSATLASSGTQASSFGSYGPVLRLAGVVLGLYALTRRG